MTNNPTALVWFRRDLRLADNPALHAALADYRTVLPIYIHAPEEEAPWAPGSASRWWLHESLEALDASLRQKGSRLILRRGPSRRTLPALCRETGAKTVFWNRLIEPAARKRDRTVETALREAGIAVEEKESALLYPPETTAKEDGTPYRVFTPFWKNCLNSGLPASARPAPNRLPPIPDGISSLSLEALKLLPKTPWYASIAACWQPGEAGAGNALAAFVDHALPDYSKGRDRPDLALTSRLSPHLHFGEISPQRVAAEAQAATPPGSGAAEAFLRELGWREFSHALLCHFPALPDTPLDARFERFPWANDHADRFEAWRRGQTGIPLVDAGMRQLWRTGWMHNRVRMVVASFLVKNLLIPWQEGARWFWDTLVDADLANNSQNWQWVAGCGADAAPYFRIFNPVLQGRKCDPWGNYVRRWVPELAKLPAPSIHAPWETKETALKSAGIRLGDDYPLPIVDLKASRKQALDAFAHIRK
ncbi:MAG: deoxyribodipyrimidine photo-lyase [Methylohalobius crimeensis]